MTNSNSSISKHYHQLTSVQRGQIQAMLDSGISRQSVAKSNAEASQKLLSAQSIEALCCLFENAL